LDRDLTKADSCALLSIISLLLSTLRLPASAGIRLRLMIDVNFKRARNNTVIVPIQLEVLA
jgi:hypothetical protein